MIWTWNTCINMSLPNVSFMSFFPVYYSCKMSQVDGGPNAKGCWIIINIQIIFPTWNYNVNNIQTYSCTSIPFQSRLTSYHLPGSPTSALSHNNAVRRREVSVGLPKTKSECHQEASQGGHIRSLVKTTGSLLINGCTLPSWRSLRLQQYNTNDATKGQRATRDRTGQLINRGGCVGGWWDKQLNFVNCHDNGQLVDGWHDDGGGGGVLIDVPIILNACSRRLAFIIKFTTANNNWLNGFAPGSWAARTPRLSTTTTTALRDGWRFYLQICTGRPDLQSSSYKSKMTTAGQLKKLNITILSGSFLCQLGDRRLQIPSA